MEVSGDILSTYLNKETLDQNQVFLLFEKILQEYFILEYVPRKTFDSLRKTNSIFDDNKNVVVFKKTSSLDVTFKKQIIFLPEHILLPDFFVVLEELEKNFSSQENNFSKDFHTMLSRIRTLCDLVYEAKLFSEVENDKTNCVVQQLTQSLRKKLTHILPNITDKQILGDILAEEKNEKGFDEVEFVGVYLERCIEEYVLRFSHILNIENRQILIEIADKFFEHSLFSEAQSIYEILSFDEKMSSGNYLEFLKKTQKWVLLDTFCLEILRKNPTNPRAKAYLIITAFHDYLESENAILILKEQYKNPNFHSLVISRMLDIIMNLKEVFILKYDITSYVGAIYFIIGEHQKAKKYFKYNSPKNKDFQTIIDQLNKE